MGKVHDRVDLPMPKLGARTHGFGSFFDASTEDLLVLTDFPRLRVTAELLREIYVLDGQKTEIHIIVEGLGADHVLSTEFAALQGCSATSIQRPVVVTLKMLYHILQE